MFLVMSDLQINKMIDSKTWWVKQMLASKHENARGLLREKGQKRR